MSDCLLLHSWRNMYYIYKMLLYFPLTTMPPPISKKTTSSIQNPLKMCFLSTWLLIFIYYFSISLSTLSLFSRHLLQLMAQSLLEPVPVLAAHGIQKPVHGFKGRLDVGSSFVESCFGYTDVGWVWVDFCAKYLYIIFY
jgi:hypothetical protein